MKKNKYDKTIQVAIDWWANVLLISKYDSGAGNDPLALPAKAISLKIISKQIK